MCSVSCWYLFHELGIDISTRMFKLPPSNTFAPRLALCVGLWSVSCWNILQREYQQLLALLARNVLRPDACYLRPVQPWLFHIERWRQRVPALCCRNLRHRIWADDVLPVSPRDLLGRRRRQLLRRRAGADLSRRICRPDPIQRTGKRRLDDCTARHCRHRPRLRRLQHHGGRRRPAGLRLRRRLLHGLGAARGAQRLPAAPAAACGRSCHATTMDRHGAAEQHDTPRLGRAVDCPPRFLARRVQLSSNCMRRDHEQAPARPRSRRSCAPPHGRCVPCRRRAARARHPEKGPVRRSTALGFRT